MAPGSPVSVPDTRLSAPAERIDIKERSVASLMWLKFKRNRLAIIGLVVMVILYFFTTFSEFFAPYTTDDTHTEEGNHPPTRIHFIDAQGRFHLRPFVYGYERRLNRSTFRVHWTEKTEEVYPIHFFIHRGTKVQTAGLSFHRDEPQILSRQGGQPVPLRHRQVGSRHLFPRSLRRARFRSRSDGLVSPSAWCWGS